MRTRKFFELAFLNKRRLIHLVYKLIEASPGNGTTTIRHHDPEAMRHFEEAVIDHLEGRVTYEASDYRIVSVMFSSGPSGADSIDVIHVPRHHSVDLPVGCIQG